MTTLLEYFFAIPVALAALFFWTWNVYRAGFERGYKTADDDAGGTRTPFDKSQVGAIYINTGKGFQKIAGAPMSPSQEAAIRGMNNDD